MPSLSLNLPVALQISGAATQTTSDLPVPPHKSDLQATCHQVQRTLDVVFGSSWTHTRTRYERITHGRWGWVDMVQLLALCGIVQGIRVWHARRAAPGKESDEIGSEDKGKASHSTRKIVESDATSTDPGLLKKHSSFKPYTTSFAHYPRVRIFFRAHPQADKLPSEPTALPLLVFIHGLGGSLAQFNPLLTSLVNVAPCLGVDLPGCGRSEFTPKSWNTYTTKALAELLIAIIKEHCAKRQNQGIVLIGHSLGCSLSVLVASAIQSVPILALVAICPQASAPSNDQAVLFERLLRVPTPIFDIWRTWDRRGGPNSASVTRFVGQDADIEVKKLQERFNKQSRTAVWRRMAWGALPASNCDSTERGLPGPNVWANLKIPMFLIGGEGDNIAKVDQIVKIGEALGKVDKPPSELDPFSSDQSCEMDEDHLSHSTGNGQPSTASKTDKTEVTVIGESDLPRIDAPNHSQTRRVLKTSILPAPASHALLYDPATYRTAAGLIHTFLSEHVDTRLSLGWQLQHLSTEGKWDVKNLVKWQAVRPVSDPIAGIFRAMKTLREIDDVHSPEIFVRDWKTKLKAVVDISHESPVYDPRRLDEGGIEYHKFPTVSKIPPTPEEAHDFIKLVDRLRTSPSTIQSEDALIGVHCHYGFNRTGFFICCYLIEKEGMGVQQAIDAFARARPPGIRHEHFLDQLFVRYCVGLTRSPTM